MKKITILVASILISIGASNAQTPVTPAGGSSIDQVRAGRWYTAGVLSFFTEKEKHEDSSGSSDGPTTNTFKFAPNAGVFVNEKIGIGLGVAYKNSTTKTMEFDNESNEVELKDKMGTVILRPSVSYYKKIAPDFYCYASYYLGFGFGTDTDEFLGFNPDTGMDEVQSQEWSVNTFKTGVKMGGTYFFDDHWGMTASIGVLSYESTTQKSKDESDLKWTESGFGLDVNSRNLSLGVKYIF